MIPWTKPLDLLYDCPKGHTLRPELVCRTGYEALPTCPEHELVCEVRPGPSLLSDRDIKPENPPKNESADSWSQEEDGELLLKVCPWYPASDTRWEVDWRRHPVTEMGRQR